MATSEELYDRAMSANNKEQVYIGQVIHVDVWPCRLEKGSGKVRIDVNSPEAERAPIAITIEISPLREDFSPVVREVLDSSTAWRNITLPSLQRLDLDLRELHEKYVKVKLASTGEKYTSRDGKERTRTALKFLTVYSSYDEARG